LTVTNARSGKLFYRKLQKWGISNGERKKVELIKTEKAKRNFNQQTKEFSFRSSTLRGEQRIKAFFNKYAKKEQKRRVGNSIKLK
jgi:hypothetical protein